MLQSKDTKKYRTLTKMEEWKTTKNEDDQKRRRQKTMTTKNEDDQK